MAINDPRDKELAKVLVMHSTKVQKGDLVFIHAVGQSTLGLAEAVCDEVLRAKASPYLHFVEPEVERKFMHGATEEAIRRRHDIELPMIEQSDCFVGIRGSDNIFEGSDVPRKKLDLFNQIMTPLRKKRVDETRWVVLRYPNPSMAQMAQMPREKFAEFYYKVCTLDYAQMSKAIAPLKQLMDKTDRVEIKGPGTDLKFSIKGIPTIPCTGTHNIPDGECFTAPVRKSIEGRVSFNAPTVWEGAPYENVVLTFEKGRVVEAQAASKEQTKRLNATLDQDEGARYIGEFAIGFNPFVKEPMRDILFDEKIGGSFHMALGEAYTDADNGNRSAVHWDLVCIQRPDYGGGEIFFDGKLIRKDGQFVPKALHKLNPEAFG